MCVWQVLVVSGGEGRCVCEMKISEDHLNSYGTLHGGLTATLVDIVSTMALLTNETTSSGVSVNLAVSYAHSSSSIKTIYLKYKLSYLNSLFSISIFFTVLSGCQSC